MRLVLPESPVAATTSNLMPTPAAIVRHSSEWEGGSPELSVSLQGISPFVAERDSASLQLTTSLPCILPAVGERGSASLQPTPSRSTSAPEHATNTGLANPVGFPVVGGEARQSAATPEAEGRWHGITTPAEPIPLHVRRTHAPRQIIDQRMEAGPTIPLSSRFVRMEQTQHHQLGDVGDISVFGTPSGITPILPARQRNGYEQQVRVSLVIPEGGARRMKLSYCLIFCLRQTPAKGTHCLQRSLFPCSHFRGCCQAQDSAASGVDPVLSYESSPINFALPRPSTHHRSAAATIVNPGPHRLRRPSLSSGFGLPGRLILDDLKDTTMDWLQMQQNYGIHIAGTIDSSTRQVGKAIVANCCLIMFLA